MSGFFIPMKKTIFIAGLILASCSSKDQQFCDCLSATTELNELSSKVLSGELSEESLSVDQKAIKSKKDKLCADYETLSGEELMKKQEDCE